MLNPYLLMALLYLAMGALMAVDASMTSFSFLGWIAGLRWLRVHFITLGVMTEVVFGVAPVLVALAKGLPKPKMRWDIWLTLNTGLIVLLVGIPIINKAMIYTGGTLVFVAASLLSWQLWQMRTPGTARRTESGSLKFYLTGLSFLLLGITIGTGLWFGWSGPLRIQVPLETHIHANNWGFMSLVFAGLLLDVLPGLTGHALAEKRTVNAIFWGMSMGALFLTIGPWLGGNLWFTVPGLVMHLTATLSLLILTIRRLSASGKLSISPEAGIWSPPTCGSWPR